MADAAEGDRLESDNMRAARPRRRPYVVIGIVVTCFAMIAILQMLAAQWDFANTNVATLILGFVALMTLVVWQLRERNASRLRRVMPLIVLLVFAGVMASILRIDRVNGRLIPTLSFRWTRKPDQILEMPVIPTREEVAVDVTTMTDRDFPQFLGPDRNLLIRSVVLATDWDKRPPELLWRRSIGAGWSGFSAVNGFAVTMEQRGDSELTTCYEITTGRPLWAHAERARHETVLGGVGPRATPTIVSGRIYTQGATGILLCLDGATGEVIWRDNILERYHVTPRQDLRAVAWGRAASPLLVDDLLVVPFGGPRSGPWFSLAGYDRQDGTLRWRGGDIQVGYASPQLVTLCGLQQIIIVNESTVSGHRLSDGKVLWSHPWPGSSAAGANVSQAAIVSMNRILLSKGYGGGAKLLHLQKVNDNQIEARTVWSNRRVLKTKFTNVVIHHQFAYALSDGILECVDLRDGQSRWKDRRRGDYGHGQILAVGDVLLVQAETGEVAMVQLQPDQFRELGRIEALTDQTWNNICLYGPYMLVRNAVEAACYKLHVREPAAEVD